MRPRRHGPALLGGPSIHRYSMTTLFALHASSRRRYAVAMLWIAWGATLWATLSLYLFTVVTVRTIEVLMFWNGRIALVGGCFGLLYVVLAARTWKLIFSGCCAAIAGFVYSWWFLYAFGNH